MWMDPWSLFQEVVEDVHLLFQLTVDRQDLRVADKGKGQNGHSVCSLVDRSTEMWL